MEEILGNYQHVIDDMKLIPGKGGVFEFNVNDQQLYSKKATGRHAADGEILQLFTDLVGSNVPRYND